MRTIKFRGKSLRSGEWFYGNLFDKDTQGRTHITTTRKGCLCIDPDTVGQFIGLKDMSGKEIYEGDIIVVKGEYERVVLWDEMGWALMPCEYYHDKMFWVMNIQHPGMDWWKLFANEIEIVGNIYDNTELLKGENK